ncbi:MAG: iron-sulfur cluster co-chaperone HscB C-terminal domain-containing protein [Bacteroidota bacterium]
MNNYFDFFGLPPSPTLDVTELRKIFLANSKKYHPDFYTLESDEKQAEILELSTLNNQAYKVLKDEDQRLKHLLEVKGVLAEEGQNAVPQDFLMEMMDINEGLMELEFESDTSKVEEVKTAVRALESKMLAEVQTIIDNYSDQLASPEELNSLKDYYLKKRYLLRIHKNLSTFAPH